MDSIDPPEGGAELNFDTHLLGLIAPFDFLSGANAVFKRNLQYWGLQCVLFKSISAFFTAANINVQLCIQV